MATRVFSFLAGHRGPWQITQISCLVGEPLPPAGRLAMVTGTPDSSPDPVAWTLRGIRSNERYVNRQERGQLTGAQQGLGRPASSCAALIPIRKTAAWWMLTQDERRAIFEEQSHHIQVGLKHLPPVARQLHHCRDLSEQEPFDFLTWFEYAPEYESAFDEMLAEMRASEEWAYVDREIDIRVVRDP